MIPASPERSRQPARDSSEAAGCRGYVVILPGVENQLFCMRDVKAGLREAGIQQEIMIRKWGIPIGGTFWNLVRLEANRAKAAEIAAELALKHEPDLRSITLIGHSAGAGMALFVAEALAAGSDVDRIVLISPAVSPSYRLEPALAHSHRGIVSFHSPGDGFILGWGTRTFGTLDRVRTDAAGRYGFVDCEGGLLHGDDVMQIAWKPEWYKLGHRGGHTGGLSRAWAREVLARYISPSEAI